LESDLYLSLKRRRVRGKEYDDFVDIFIKSVQELYPMAMLHFEDFGLVNARRLLEKYTPQLACFNGEHFLISRLIADDIQGTGCVSQAAVKSAVWVAKGKVADQKIVIFGAGTAGTGSSPPFPQLI
jgi:malate dehydrogenase (oxaloacetate-decarboxylating)